MKIRLVLRESNDTLKEGYGFINQRDDCLGFTTRYGHEIAKEHPLVESSSTWSRENFGKIVKEAIEERDESPGILFPRVDRFARNLEAAGFYLGLLRQNGLTVMFAQENLVVDNEASVMSVLMFYIHSFKADQDGKQLKHNLLKGRDRLATDDQEIPNGMVIWPFDYQAKRNIGKLSNGKPAINFERAAWVRKWADWMLDKGIGINEICLRMNKKKVPSPRASKGWKGTTGKWSPKAIRDISRSRQLVGEFCWKGKLYLKDDNLRIMSDEQFEAIQKRLDENRERSYYNAAKYNYPPLRKMVVHSCGQKMYGVPLNKKPFYRCPKCRKSNIIASTLWDEVQRGIKNALKRDDWLISQLLAQFDKSHLIEKMEQDIAKINNDTLKYEEAKDTAFRMGMMLNHYSLDKVQEQIDEADKNMQRLNMEKSKLENKLQKLKEQRLDEEGLKRFCQLVKDNIDKLTKNQWQLLNELINLRITVFSRELIIVDASLPTVPKTNSEIEFSHL
jgi:DNA invertase Pin-like site-specific DNA recombinase